MLLRRGAPRQHASPRVGGGANPRVDALDASRTLWGIAGRTIIAT
jgi:hypothetical protein